MIRRWRIGGATGSSKGWKKPKGRQGLYMSPIKDFSVASWFIILEKGNLFSAINRAYIILN